MKKPAFAAVVVACFAKGDAVPTFEHLVLFDGTTKEELMVPYRTDCGPDCLAEAAVEGLRALPANAASHFTRQQIISAMMDASPSVFDTQHTDDAYLSLLRRSLAGRLQPQRMHKAVNSALSFTELWPALALTMVPTEGLRSLEWMVETVVREKVPARVILEAGVWRGGASIYAAAVLERALTRRAREGPIRPVSASPESWTVVLCDSFRGLPLSSTKHDGE